MLGKNVVARTKNFISHTHTHTHTHWTTAIPSLLACGGEGNDRRTTKVLSSRLRITCGETKKAINGCNNASFHSIPLQLHRLKLEIVKCSSCTVVLQKAMHVK